MKKNSMPEVLQDFLKSRFNNMHTAIPGTFESYEGAPSFKCSVKPTINFKTPNNQDIEMPIIENVPVIFPSSGTFSMRFPINKGDGCLIIFSETGIGNYLAGTGQSVNSDDQSRFSLTDAIAIPGLWTFLNGPQLPTIELDSTGLLKLFTGSEAFLKGTSFIILLEVFLTVLAGIVPGDVTANATALTAIKSAAAAMLTGTQATKSIKVFGE